MTVIFTELDALARAIRERFGSSAIIGVDGWTGVGKTTLGNALAGILNGAAYDLDDALSRDRKVYLSALRIGEVADALESADGLLFVSGICLREAIAMADCKADAHIYVKRMAVWGWADEVELTGGTIPEMPGASGEVVREELRRYHESWRPHVRSDYEFHRLD